jgi:hypothetical protein
VALEAVRNPFRRAETLLSLTEEQRAGVLDDAVKRLPPGFLMEQLELQEEIQDGLADDRRKVLKKDARRRLKRLQAELSETFAALDDADAASDPESARRSALTTIAGAISQSRYWRNIQTAIRGDVPQ